MEKELYPELPILIVDDEEFLLDYIEKTLRLNGISNVQCCIDSLEVMSLLEKKEFSLIVLDIMMPGIRGDELLPLIVEKYPDIPVILLGYIGDNIIASECMEKGAFDLISKPFEKYRLLFAINNALKYKKITVKGDRQEFPINHEEPQKILTGSSNRLDEEERQFEYKYGKYGALMNPEKLFFKHYERIKKQVKLKPCTCKKPCRYGASSNHTSCHYRRRTYNRSKEFRNRIVS